MDCPTLRVMLVRQMLQIVLPVSVLTLGCGPGKEATPVTVPLDGNIVAVQDRWEPHCATPAPIYPTVWDSTLADTAVILAAPMNADTIAQMFGVTRREDGLLWYDSQGRGGEPYTGTDSVRVGPWQVVAGQYEYMTYTDDISDTVDQSGRTLPEHWRQSWFYGFAPTSAECAVVVAWRSPPIGSYRGPRYANFEIARESLQVIFTRVTGPGTGHAPKN
ncbi:MAG TPA: hypothetical protein VJ717_10685 [Gemmatimonadaceae bacterium]|nr:hypothetical protein [Gemmatimonadaceae bacterium]